MKTKNIFRLVGKWEPVAAHGHCVVEGFQYQPFFWPLLDGFVAVAEYFQRQDVVRFEGDVAAVEVGFEGNVFERVQHFADFFGIPEIIVPIKFITGIFLLDEFFPLAYFVYQLGFQFAQVSLTGHCFEVVRIFFRESGVCKKWFVDEAERGGNRFVVVAAGVDV